MGPAWPAPAGALLLGPAALNSIRAARIHLLLLQRDCLCAAQRHAQMPAVTPALPGIRGAAGPGSAVGLSRLNCELISFYPATLLLIKSPCSAQHWVRACLL